MKKLFSILLLSAFAYSAQAQESFMHSDCSSGRKKLAEKRSVHAKSTNLIPEEDYYDIKHVELNLKLTDTSIFVQGNVKTAAEVVVPAMNNYAFELDSMLTIDSIIFNGLYSLPFTTQGFVRMAALPFTINQGASFNVRVYYSGTPPTGTGFFTGIIHAVSGGTHMVYTVSDPYATKDWWPAKQALQDKIDSVDMHVTVPDYCKAGSNGLLQSETPAGSGLTAFHWKTKYPIDYYLISLAIADYSEKKFYMHFSNSNDSMLIQHFFYDSASFVNNHIAKFDSVALMTDYFSTLLGRYPFWKEKYGHCFTTLGGGMEHQTMTTIGVTDTRTIAHELMHQWFGNNVTYKQWYDVWLSEGFATYAEQLFIEHWWSTAAMKSFRTGQFNNVMTQPGGKVIVSDTTNIYALFDSRLVYRKGAAVAHMLRFMAPDDSTYFDGLRQFQAQYAYGLATSDDLKNVMAATYGANLDTFFSQWVYGEGYPTYTANWSQAGPDVSITLNQTASMVSSVPLFHTPLEIKLKSPFGDTIVKVYNNQPQQTYTFTFSNWMNGIEIDPNEWILNKTGTITHVGEVLKDKLHIAPNPTKDQWLIKNLEENELLRLMDATGRLVWTGRSTKGNTVIPAQHLAPGNYILQVGEVNKGTVQLVKF
jgi:aminopeptidase N